MRYATTTVAIRPIGPWGTALVPPLAGNGVRGDSAPYVASRLANVLLHVATNGRDHHRLHANLQNAHLQDGAQKMPMRSGGQ